MPELNDNPAIYNSRQKFHRLGILIGEKTISALEQKQALIVGLGGVGSWAAEALVRSGFGQIVIADYDKICITNINRQIQALHNTIGYSKAEALKKRLLDINPACKIGAIDFKFSREAAPLFKLEEYDYIIDAIDDIPCKLDLIQLITEAERPILFSSMGMACRLDPCRIKTADIWETRACPLARLVRQGLRKRKYSGAFTAVYSDEPALASAITPAAITPATDHHKINGSFVGVTAAAGMILASLVIRDMRLKQRS